MAAVKGWADEVLMPRDEAYPESAAFSEHTLKASELHTVHYWQAGKPDGKPVVFLHGGPGSGTSGKDTTFFDPAVYRVVLIDQRGAGKSTPSGEIRENTTWDLVADIEAVRSALGIERWLVFGGSWGSTLSLAYAETHPDRCVGLIIRGIYLSTRQELEWTYKDGANHLWPDSWAKFYNHIPEGERDDLMGAYFRRMCSEDKDEALAAARLWSVWEDSTAKLVPDPEFIARSEDDAFALAIGRIEAHYFTNYGFMPDGHLVSEAMISRIRDIPTIIVQGRYDCVCPVSAAWRLKKAFGPRMRTYIVDDAGHSAHEPGTRRLLLGATDEYARTLTW